jgi:membrane fusion protein (multidrug efflux system)
MALASPRNIAIAAAAAVVVLGGGAWWMSSQGGADGAHAAGGPGRGPGGPGGPGGRGATEVVAVPVTPLEFMSQIEALGTLEPREQVNLTANASDRVTGVYFEDGQRVRKGAILMRLSTDEENAQLEASQATLAEAQRTLERNKRLSAEGATSESELQRSVRDADSASANVRAVEARLRDRVLVAPFSGVVGFRQVSSGAFVSPGQVVGRLIDDSSMRLEFAVPSVFLTSLRVGLPIEGKTADLMGMTFNGSLTSIDNAIDPVTRTVKVRATLPNEEGHLRTGMFMTVNLASQPRTSLAVPEIATVAEGSQTFVFVVDQTKQPAVANKVEVELGERQRGVIEVVSGLQSGDLVITDGILKIRPGAPVQVRTAPLPAGGEEGAARLAAGDAPSDKAGLRQ